MSDVNFKLGEPLERLSDAEVEARFHKLDGFVQTVKAERRRLATELAKRLQKKRSGP